MISSLHSSFGCLSMDILRIMHDTTKKKRHPALLPCSGSRTRITHYTGAKRHLHKNLPTNVRSHRRYISSHSLFEWATWSTKFACGFAHPVAFVDPCLTRRPCDNDCPTSTWLTCRGFIDVHTDSRLMNSHLLGLSMCPTHISAPN